MYALRTYFVDVIAVLLIKYVDKRFDRYSVLTLSCRLVLKFVSSFDVIIPGSFKTVL